MGSYLTVWASLECDACGEKYETAVEVDLAPDAADDTPDETIAECRAGDRVENLDAPASHVGVRRRYCPRCDTSAHIAEMTAHMDQLANAVDRGEVQLYSEYWVFAPEPEPPGPGERTRQRPEPLTSAEIRVTPTRARGVEIIDIWDLLPSVPLAVYRGDTPLFPTAEPDFDPWWDLHFEAVADALAEQGWLPDGRWAEVAVEIDGSHRVRVGDRQR